MLSNFIRVKEGNKECLLYAKNDFMVTAAPQDKALPYRFLVCGYPTHPFSHATFPLPGWQPSKGKSTCHQDVAPAFAKLSPPAQATEAALSFLLDSSLEAIMGISLTAIVWSSGAHVTTRINQGILGWGTLKSTVTPLTPAQLLTRHTHECCRWYGPLSLSPNPSLGKSSPK